MKLKTITFLLMLLFFYSCSNTKRITELQNQVQVLEKELSKRKHENMELRSFTSSLDEQFKKYPSIYVKICQTEDIETIESLFLKYSQLLQNYNQLQSSYKSLRENSETGKMNSEKAILELKSQYDKVQQPDKIKKVPKMN